jgi:uncharacterized ParB-like nuclease family protein
MSAVLAPEQAGEQQQLPVVMLELSRIRLDGDTQSREVLCSDTAHEYAEDLAAGKEFPPLVVYHDGTHYWLSSGFHRYHAHKIAKRSHVACVVHKGTVHDARLHAASTNTMHGLKRTHADKRRAVWMVLSDPIGKAWSPERIARHCDVSQGLVKDIMASTPWQPQMTLWGEPDDLEKPPAPDGRNRETATPTNPPSGQPAPKTGTDLVSRETASGSGGTVAPEDAGDSLSEADRVKVHGQVKRLVVKLNRKAALLREDPLDLVKMYSDTEDGEEGNGEDA